MYFAMILDEVKKQLKSLPAFKKVVVGVSGGADSVALAHILIKLGYNVTIAHLNHGLRGKDSDKDADFVKTLAQKWKVPFVTFKVTIPKKGNLEEQARNIRYEFLEKIRKSQNAKFVAVAHHRDDQIETILLHIQRGAGLRGLCGMSLVNGTIIRPFLNISKKDILSYLKKENLSYRTDESNFNLNFSRNYFRHVVITKLKRKHKNFESNLLHLSEIACKKIEKIEKQAKHWIESHVTNNEFKRTLFLTLTDDTQSEVIFMLTGYNDIYRQSVNELKGFIKNGATGKQKKICNKIFHICYDKVLITDSAKPVDLPKIKLGKKEIRWGNWLLKYNGRDVLYVRQWKSGDKFEPSGMSGNKKLQDFFVDRKIPKTDRHYIPIIVDKDDNILSVSNFRVAKHAMHLKKYLQINKIK